MGKAERPGVRLFGWRGGVHAGLKPIEALGYDLYTSAKRRIAGSPTAAIAAILWFVSRIRSFRELLATGRDECCALIETVVAAAPRAKTPVDVSDIQAMTPSA
jgi:2-dehydropantoate 2-reductase